MYVLLCLGHGLSLQPSSLVISTERVFPTESSDFFRERHRFLPLDFNRGASRWSRAEYPRVIRTGDHWRDVCDLADLRAIKTNGGKCERCHRNPMDCHHHWTYRSLGREEFSLVDVLACCSKCHAYLAFPKQLRPCRPSAANYGFTPDFPPDHDFVPDPDAHEEYGQGYMIDQWGIWQIRSKVEPRPTCVACGWVAEALDEDDKPICKECLRQRSFLNDPDPLRGPGGCRPDPRPMTSGVVLHHCQDTPRDHQGRPHDDEDDPTTMRTTP